MHYVAIRALDEVTGNAGLCKVPPLTSPLGVVTTLTPDVWTTAALRAQSMCKNSATWMAMALAMYWPLCSKKTVSPMPQAYSLALQT